MCDLLTKGKYAAIAAKFDFPARPFTDGIFTRGSGPIAVDVAVLPWNLPLMMLARKIGPALAAGRSVIFKPAEKTTLTRLRMAEPARMAGVPRSDLQVLPGDGPTVGAPLGAYRDVDMVSFAGATGTGRRFLKDAAQSILKKVVLECGHKTPAVVLKDAANLDHVGEGAFWRAGRNCLVVSCLLMMHKNVKAPCLMMSRPSSRSNV